MNGDPRTPQLGSFNASDPERVSRLLGAHQLHPDAVIKVAKKQKDMIISAKQRGERCFSVGMLNFDGDVMEAATYAASLLPWVRKGALLKDKEFVRYIETHDPRIHHPVYVSWPSGFIAVVIDSAPLMTREDLVRTFREMAAAATPNAQSDEEKADFKKICMNSFCGARDVPMFTCAQCKNAWYCCVDCQKKDWRIHKVYCNLFKKPQ